MLDRAIHLQFDAACIQMPNGRCRLQRPNRAGPLKGFADLPRTALLFRFALQIAARHVEADGIAPDMLQRIAQGDVGAATFQRHHKLDLVMHVVAVRGIGKLAGGIEVVGVLLKEERRFAIRVMPHLNRMGRIVAADAIDAAHRKGTAATDRNGWNRRCGDDEVGHVSPLGNDVEQTL